MALRGSALSWKAGHEQSCDPCRMLDQRAQCPGMQEAKHAQLMRSRTMNSAPRVAVDGTRDSRKNGPAALCERHARTLQTSAIESSRHLCHRTIMQSASVDEELSARAGRVGRHCDCPERASARSIRSGSGLSPAASPD